MEKELTGRGTVGAYLFQGLQEPDPGDRDGGPDARRGQIARLLSGDDLRRLPAGAHLDNGDPKILLNSISCYCKFLPGEQLQVFPENLWEKAVTP